MFVKNWYFTLSLRSLINIFNEIITLPQMFFFTHFASANQLSTWFLHLSGTLGTNGLTD